MISKKVVPKSAVSKAPSFVGTSKSTQMKAHDVVLSPTPLHVVEVPNV